MRKWWQSLDPEVVTAFVVVIGLGLLGIGSLYLRDYVRNRLRRGESFLPKWVLVILATLFVLGMLALGATGIGILFWALFCAVLYYLSLDREAQRSQWQAGLLLELAEALRQRVALHRYFEALSVDNKVDRRVALASVAEQLRRGGSLSQALGQEGLLPVPALATLRAGEAGGGARLALIARHLGRELGAEGVRKTRLAACFTYPFAVCVMVGTVGLFLGTFVLPKFTYILDVMGCLSRWGWPKPVVRWSRVEPWGWEFLRTSAGWPLLWQIFALPLGALVLYLFLRLLFGVAHSGMRSRSWREAPPSPLGLLWLRFKAGLPVLRTRERHRGLARAARTLGMLLEAGLTLPEACREVAVPELAGPYAGAFHELGQAALRGATFESALRQSRLPESFLVLAAAGAVGGELPAALFAVAEWHTAKAERLDQRLAFAVPCITIPLAGLVVGVFFLHVFTGIGTVVNLPVVGRWR